MASITVAVMNASTVLTDAEVKAVVPALQTQVHNHFAPAWGIDADLTFVANGDRPPAGAWWLAVLDDSDQAGALGYHDLTNEGLPLGKVFAGTDKQLGYQWSVTASHELLEILADPDVDLSVFVQADASSGALYAYEVCDACEDDQFGYQIDGVLVSDFVYPAWFETFRQPGSTQFDQGQLIRQPLQLLQGGYIGVFDVTAGTGWTQKLGDGRAPRYAARPRVGSRRERRRTPRDQWQKSEVAFGIVPSKVNVPSKVTPRRVTPQEQANGHLQALEEINQKLEQDPNLAAAWDDAIRLLAQLVH